MRNGPNSLRFLAVLVLGLAARSAVAVELGIEGDFGNLQFPWTPIAPLSQSTFPSDNFFVGSQAWITTPLGEDAAIKVSYDRDPVLRNSAEATVQFDRGIASLAVGPFIGLFNTDATPWSAGMSASLKLQWPGVAYVSLRNDGGMAISVLPIAGDPQSLTELSAGLYVPHGIVSGLVSAKRFNEVDAGGSLVTDSLTRYAMTVDVFKKDVPYTALLSLGYELRSKYFAATQDTDALGAIVLGIDSTVQLNPAYKLLADFSTGAYVFGLGSLQGRGPTSNSFLFSAGLGLSVNLAAIPPAPPKAASAKASAAPETEPGPEAAPSTAPETEQGADQGAPNADQGSPTTAPEEAPAEPQATAPAKKGPGIDAGVGLCYDALPLTGTALDALLFLFYTRGGAWGDLMVPLKNGISVGGELGFYYMSSTIQGITINLVDVPILAKASFTTGKIRFEGFGGLYPLGVLSSVASAFQFGLDLGGRLSLGGLYAEGSYVWGLGSAQSFPRYGLGYSIRIK
jgi:hypothetical protein